MERTIRPRTVPIRMIIVAGVLVIAVTGAQAFVRARQNAASLATAAQIAARVGCSDSYRGGTPNKPETGAGECRVTGATLQIRTFGTQDQAYAWANGTREAAPDSSVRLILSNRWAVRVTGADAATFAAISGRLRKR